MSAFSQDNAQKYGQEASAPFSQTLPTRRAVLLLSHGYVGEKSVYSFYHQTSLEQSYEVVLA